MRYLNHLAVHAWEGVLFAIDKMSVAKAVTISGAGSVFSLGSAAAAPDLALVNAYLKTATLGVGVMAGLAAVGVGGLKAWLLWKHRNTPPSF